MHGRGWLVPSIAAPVIAFVAALTAGVLLYDPVDAVFGALLAAAAIFIAVVDLDRFEIPDTGSFAMLVFGLAWTLEASGLDAEAFVEALLRSVAAAAILYAVRAGYRAVRGFEGLGLGDVKLAGAGALWLSWSHITIALLIAVGGAIIVVIGRSVFARERIDAHAAIPFGAFLAPAIWIGWFAQVNGVWA